MEQINNRKMKNLEEVLLEKGILLGEKGRLMDTEGNYTTLQVIHNKTKKPYSICNIKWQNWLNTKTGNRSERLIYTGYLIKNGKEWGGAKYIDSYNVQFI